jgi:hypothetical protein
MKRDKTLIKEILLFAEEYEGKGMSLITAEILNEHFRRFIEPSADIPLKDFLQHGQLIIDHGLVKGNISKAGIIISSITWEGYEFLDNARDVSVWNSSLKFAGHYSWKVFTNVLTQVATESAVNALRIRQ